MKANQKSLVGDERGEINIGIIGVALVLVIGISGLILVMVSPVLPEKMGINVPDDSQWANTFDASDLVSGIGWGLLIAAILGGVLVLLWKYMGS